MMLKGRNVKMDEAKEKGIVDQVVESNLLDAALALAKEGGKRRVSQRKPYIGKGIADNALPPPTMATFEESRCAWLGFLSG